MPPLVNGYKDDDISVIRQFDGCDISIISSNTDEHVQTFPPKPIPVLISSRRDAQPKPVISKRKLRTVKRFNTNNWDSTLTENPRSPHPVSWQWICDHECPGRRWQGGQRQPRQDGQPSGQARWWTPRPRGRGSPTTPSHCPPAPLNPPQSPSSPSPHQDIPSSPSPPPPPQHQAGPGRSPS